MQSNIITKNNEWDRIIEKFPNSSIYHTASWKKLLEKHGCKGFLIVAEDGDSITGILPVYVKKSRIFHFKELVSIPFCGENGLSIAQKHKETLKTLLRGWMELVKQLSPVRSEFITNIPLNCNGNVKPLSKYTFRNEKYTLKYVWENVLNKDARRQIRKSMNKGVTVSIENDPLFFLTYYYEMYEETRKRRKFAVSFSENFFKNLLKKLKKYTVLFVAKLHNKPISAAINFCYRDVMYGWGISSSMDGLRYRSNDLIYWNAIKWIVENGYKCVDFGPAIIGIDVGIHRMKQKYQTHIENAYIFRINHSKKADFEDLVISVGKSIKDLILINPLHNKGRLWM